MTPELTTAIATARQAGAILMKYFDSDLKVSTKADQFDPVTQADVSADEFLRSTIATAFPNDAILSEEHAPQPDSYKGRIWMVDPLDGTKDFIAGRDTFSVIIGLLVNGVPTMGIVFMPAKNELFYAQKNSGAFRRFDGKDLAISVSNVMALAEARMSVRIPAKELRPLDSVVEALAVKEKVAGGSIGSRICNIASGTLDIFVNTNHRASKWDTLGAEVILHEAGGVILNSKGERLDYSQPQAKWQELFVAASSQELAEQAIKQVFVPNA